MKSLRGRLIASHILPLLIVAPLLAVTVSYLLRAQEQLTVVSTQLGQQAQQIAQLSNSRPGIWSDTSSAHLFVVEIIRQDMPGAGRVDVMLIQPGGSLLAASDPSAREQVGQLIDLPEMRLVLSEEGGYLTVRAEVANVFVPVVREEQVVGLVRLLQELDEVTAAVLRLRWILLVALVAEVVLGIGLGYWLALRMERRLAVATTAVAAIDSSQPEKLPVDGPREFQALFRAYNSLVERLQALESARTQLLANTVHELARPLGALRSAIQALIVGADADPAFRRELLQGMDAQVKRLQPLLDNMVELHDQATGEIKLNLKPTGLSHLLPQVALPWQIAAQEKGVNWTQNVPEKLPEMMIDPDKMAQALGNLLSNGVKYTPAGGEVTLSVQNGAGEVRIAVMDTGPGLESAELDQIFEPLYRGSNGTRFPQGMGLGLTIARDLVRAHGGRLEVSSHPGIGSRFEIILPL